MRAIVESKEPASGVPLSVAARRAQEAAVMAAVRIVSKEKLGHKSVEEWADIDQQKVCSATDEAHMLLRLVDL